MCTPAVPCSVPLMEKVRSRKPCLQLDIVVEDSDLLARLERWQADVRASITAESIA